MCFSKIKLNSAIPEFTISTNQIQIFMFSAVTWNRHHIHYSKDAAIAEGLPDVVVQRGLIGNYFARTLTNWTQRPDCIKKLEWIMKSSALPNETLNFNGQVTNIYTDKSSLTISCKLKVNSSDNRIIALAESEIIMPI